MEVKQMIISNLPVLLAERKLSITKVSEDTKISRTTLTSLMYNRLQGIQVDTLNTLCFYLGVNPSDVLAFIPYNFSFDKFYMETCAGFTFENEARGSFLFNIDSLNRQLSIELDAFIYPLDNDEYSTNLRYSICLLKCSEQQSITLVQLFSTIPIPFKTEILEQIRNYLNGNINKKDLIRIDSVVFEGLE
jgi:DNA-binding Xre family transcriptional regulator